MSDKHFRLIGLFILIVSSGMLYIAFFEPIIQARAGKVSVMDGSKVVMLLPLATIMAIALLVRGKSFFDAVGKDNGRKLTRLGWCIFAIGAVMGFALAFWHADLLSSLGYTRRSW